MNEKPGRTFREKIYDVVAEIPRGKVASYGLVALLAGRVGAARAVGAAMREVPASWNGRKLPCHRVIKADGRLAPGHVFGGRQARMLKAERVALKKDGRVDMGRSQWDGDRRKKRAGRIVFRAADAAGSWRSARAAAGWR